MQHQSIIQRQAELPPLYLPGMEIAPQSTGLPDPHYFYIYLLLTPKTRVPRYVGMTRNPPKRLVEHLSATGVARDVAGWIAAQRVLNRRPIMWLVDILASEQHARKAETKWLRICVARQGSFALLNHFPRLTRTPNERTSP